MNGKDKARLLGLLFWLYTGFNLLIVAVIAVIYLTIFGAVFSQVPHKANEPDPAVIMTILIVVFAFALAFTVLFSVPKMIAGYGLRNEKSWARTWAIVASIMACMSFPFGTAIGVFGLVFIFGDDGKRYFGDPAFGRGQIGAPAQVSAPPPNSWQ